MENAGHLTHMALSGVDLAIIADPAGFHGLITRFDLINHLRRTLK